MPAYTYKCKVCHLSYEKRKRFSESHDISCPSCGGEVYNVIAQVGVMFKGSGFYINDSRQTTTTTVPATAEKPSETKPSESTAEQKSGTTTESKSELKSEPTKATESPKPVPAA